MKESREFVLIRKSSNDLEIINTHAAELNAKVEDVLSYQVIP